MHAQCTSKRRGKRRQKHREDDRVILDNSEKAISSQAEVDTYDVHFI